MSNFISRRALVCLVGVTLALFSAAAASAQTKPFKVRGSGIAPEGLPLPGQEPRSHWISGTATHLGRHSGEGSVRTDFAAFNPNTGRIEGEFGSGSAFVFTAANGDKLATYYGRVDKGAAAPGKFELTILVPDPNGAHTVQAVWIAEFVVQPELSTGRFAGATGSWIMIARSQAFVLGSDDPIRYSWEGEGHIAFQK